MEVFGIAPADTKARGSTSELANDGLRIRGDRSKAVYVQTTDGYGVLLSPQEPDKLLAALNMHVGR